MDFQSSYYFTLALLFISLFFVYQLLKTIGSSSNRSIPNNDCNLNLPPGPRKLPLIGSLHVLAMSSSPHTSLRDLAKKHGPLMHLQLGQVPAVVVSSAPMAKEVMKTQDLTFATRPDLQTTKVLFYNNRDIAFCPYGDYWREMRKICVMELLGPQNVRSFSSIRRDEVSRLVSRIKSSVLTKSVVNINHCVSWYTTSVLCRAAFGNTFKFQDKLLILLKEMSTFVSGFDISDLFPSMKLFHYFLGKKGKLMKLHKKIDTMLEKIIIEHGKKITAGKKCSGDESKNDGDDDDEDLVDVLLRIKENGSLKFPLTHNNIKAIIWDMFSGGTDTSASTVEWAMSELIKKPKALEQAQIEVRQTFKGRSEILEDDIKDLSYLKMVIKETLRLHPPAPLLVPRECREATRIDGFDIPARTKIIVNYWAIARDPNYWLNAEKFEPERFVGNSIDFMGNNFEFIPFGAGRRMCPGISFGMANVELSLAQLLYHFDWKLPNGMKPELLDMAETCGITVSRKNSLCLVATPFDHN